MGCQSGQMNRRCGRLSTGLSVSLGSACTVDSIKPTKGFEILLHVSSWEGLSLSNCIWILTWRGSPSLWQNILWLWVRCLETGTVRCTQWRRSGWSVGQPPLSFPLLPFPAPACFSCVPGSFPGKTGCAMSSSRGDSPLLVSSLQVLQKQERVS